MLTVCNNVNMKNVIKYRVLNYYPYWGSKSCKTPLKFLRKNVTPVFSGSTSFGNFFDMITTENTFIFIPSWDDESN